MPSGALFFFFSKIESATIDSFSSDCSRSMMIQITQNRPTLSQTRIQIKPLIEPLQTKQNNSPHQIQYYTPNNTAVRSSETKYIHLCAPISKIAERSNPSSSSHLSMLWGYYCFVFLLFLTRNFRPTVKEGTNSKSW